MEKTVSFMKKCQSVKSSAATKGCVVYGNYLFFLRWSWGLVSWTLRRKYNQVNMITGSFDSWPLLNKNATKKGPQSYWLRQHSLVCLCWTLHFSAHNDTPNKNHSWPTWRVSHQIFSTWLQPASHQKSQLGPHFVLNAVSFTSLNNSFFPFTLTILL